MQFKTLLYTLHLALFTILISGCATTKIAKKTQEYDYRAYLHYSMGAMQEYEGLIEEAITDYEKALLYASQETLIRQHLGILYNKKGLKDKAFQEFKKAVEVEPEDPQAHFILGNFFQGEKMWKEAEAEFKKVIKLSSEYAEAYFSLGSLYTKLEKWRNAIENYNKVIQIVPDDPIPYYNLGFCYSRLNDNLKAISCYKKAVELNSEWASPRFNLGILYEMSGDTESALKQWKEFINLSPQDPEPYLRIGYLYFQAAMYNESIFYMKKALEMDSGVKTGMSKIFPQVYLFLGIAHTNLHQNKEAIEVYNKFLELEPKNEIARYNLAALYDKEGAFEGAVKEFRYLIKSSPKCADALNYLGYMFAEKGINLNEAEELIKNALKIEPNNGYFIDSLGWVYFKMGFFKDALRELKRAVQFTKNDPIIFDHLGDAYIKNGMYQEAISAWQKSLQLQKDNEEVRKKIKEVKESKNRLTNF